MATAALLVAAWLPGRADAADVPTCLGLRATIVGTEGDDVLTGTDGPDVIAALGGTDVVHGGGGDDVICGGGNPLVIVEPEFEFDPDYPLAELLYGDDGDDRIAGGDGFDTIYGGDGDDWVSVGTSQPWPTAERPHGQGAEGGPGDDTLRAGLGHDVNRGKGGTDRCRSPRSGPDARTCER